MGGIREGYNAGWGLLGTDAGKAIAEEYEKQNDPKYEDKKWIQDYIDSQMPAAPTAPQAQPMAPIDFSNAPSWWNKGGDQQNPSSPMTPQQPPAPVQPQQPAAPAAPRSPLMYDILGNVGGRTGITGQQALSSALRAGGESNGQ